MSGLNKNNLILGIIGIFLLIIIGVIVTISLPSQNIIGDSCTLEDQGTSFNSYTCPDDALNCEITVSLECDVPSQEPKVILRWVDGIRGPEAIAYDVDNDGNMDRLKRKDSTGSGGVVLERFPLGSGYSELLDDDGDIKVSYPISAGRTAYAVYELGGGIPTSTSSIDGFEGDELFEGSLNTYTCEEQVTGAKTRTVSYGSEEPGITTDKFSISSGQTINYDGIITYDNAIGKESACTGNIPGSTPNSYIECSVDNNGCGILGQEIFCPDDYIFNENTRECNVPYEAVLNLDKKIYGSNEEITGNIKISQNNNLRFIEVEVLLEDNLDNTVGTTLTSTTSSGQANFNIDGLQKTGTYTVQATILHPDGIITVSDFISIEVPISIRLSPEPDRIQYTSDNIQAKAFITDSDGNPENVVDWDFSGTKCGSISQSNNVAVKRIKTGEYLLSTPISNECTFVYKAAAIDDSGFKTEADSVSIEVKDSEILIRTDLSSIQDKDAGRYTISFTTLDPSQQPVSTNNQVVVIDSNGCRTGEFCVSTNEIIPEVTVAGSSGFYTFSNNYIDGLNTIEISSSGAGQIGSTQQEFIVNLFPSGSSTPIGDSGSGLPIGTIVTVILVLLGVGGTLWFIFKK